MRLNASHYSTSTTNMLVGTSLSAPPQSRGGFTLKTTARQRCRSRRLPSCLNMDGVPDPCVAGIAVCLPTNMPKGCSGGQLAGIFLSSKFSRLWSLYQLHGPSVCPDPLPPSELQARPQWFHQKWYVHRRVSADSSRPGRFSIWRWLGLACRIGRRPCALPALARHSIIRNT